MFPLPTFSASFHSEFSFPVNGFWGSLSDSVNNFVNKILFFFRFRDGGDGGNWEVDLIWSRFWNFKITASLEFFKPSRNINGDGFEGHFSVTVRAFIPPELIGRVVELELGEWIHGDKGGNGADIGRLLGIGMGKCERDNFNHGTGNACVGSGDLFSIFHQAHFQNTI